MASISSVSSSDYSLPGINKASGKGNRHHDKQIEFEQDLAQAGLNASVTPDALLNSIQSAIKTAVNDPKNADKDFLQVIQDAVQATLKDNGVDTDKLTALLQSQLGQAGQAPSFQDALLAPTGADEKPPRHGPKYLNPVGNDAMQNDQDEDDLIKAKPVRRENGDLSKPSQQVDANSPTEVASEFKRLLAHLIQSLPSGSALDVKA